MLVGDFRDKHYSKTFTIKCMKQLDHPNHKNNLISYIPKIQMGIKIFSAVVIPISYFIVVKRFSFSVQEK